MLFSRFRLSNTKLRNMEMKSYNRLRTTLAVMAAAFLCLTAYADDGIFLAKPERRVRWPRLS